MEWEGLAPKLIRDWYKYCELTVTESDWPPTVRVTEIAGRKITAKDCREISRSQSKCQEIFEKVRSENEAFKPLKRDPTGAEQDVSIIPGIGNDSDDREKEIERPLNLRDVSAMVDDALSAVVERGGLPPNVQDCPGLVAGTKFGFSIESPDAPSSRHLENLDESVSHAINGFAVPDEEDPSKLKVVANDEVMIDASQISSDFVTTSTLTPLGFEALKKNPVLPLLVSHGRVLRVKSLCVVKEDSQSAPQGSLSCEEVLEVDPSDKGQVPLIPHLTEDHLAKLESVKGKKVVLLYSKLSNDDQMVSLDSYRQQGLQSSLHPGKSIKFNSFIAGLIKAYDKRQTQVRGSRDPQLMLNFVKNFQVADCFTSSLAAVQGSQAQGHPQQVQSLMAIGSSVSDRFVDLGSKGHTWNLLYKADDSGRVHPQSLQSFDQTPKGVVDERADDTGSAVDFTINKMLISLQDDLSTNPGEMKEIQQELSVSAWRRREFNYSSYDAANAYERILKNKWTELYPIIISMIDQSLAKDQDGSSFAGIFVELAKMSPADKSGELANLEKRLIPKLFKQGSIRYSLVSIAQNLGNNLQAVFQFYEEHVVKHLGGPEREGASSLLWMAQSPFNRQYMEKAIEMGADIQSLDSDHLPLWYHALCRAKNSQGHDEELVKFLQEKGVPFPKDKDTVKIITSSVDGEEAFNLLKTKYNLITE